MLPPFDETGNLPSGVHKAEWGEFVDRYGMTPHRQELLAGLRIAMTLLAGAGCRQVYVDGRFITAKPTPGDYDACWETTSVDLIHLERVAPLLLRFFDRGDAIRATFGGDLFPVQVGPRQGGPTMFEFFQRDRVTGHPKGIVALDPRRLT